jgi:hypothetical protein
MPASLRLLRLACRADGEAERRDAVPRGRPKQSHRARTRSSRAATEVPNEWARGVSGEEAEVEPAPPILEGATLL